MLKDDFTYHAPNEHTAPRYALLREQAILAKSVISKAHNYGRRAIIDGLSAQSFYDAVNETCLEFASLCEKLCPPSSDLSAAIRCIRLVRMYVNETISTDTPVSWEKDGFINMQLLLARMQACSAIALADVSELPPLDPQS